MSNLTTFFFNGEEYFVTQEVRLNELLEYFTYESTLFVVEYNRFICNKKKWNEIVIQKNDIIEIITIVGGG